MLPVPHTMAQQQQQQPTMAPPSHPRHGTTKPRCQPPCHHPARRGLFSRNWVLGLSLTTWPWHRCGAKQPTLTSLASKTSQAARRCLFFRCWGCRSCLGLETPMRLGWHRCGVKHATLTSPASKQAKQPAVARFPVARAAAHALDLAPMCGKRAPL